MDSPGTSNDTRSHADRMTDTIDAEAQQRLYVQSLQDIATLAREDLHNMWELHERKNLKVHNKFDRELADRNLTISLQRLDDAKLKRLVVLTQLRVEGHEDTIATLTTELQLLSDELQRVYSAHQATLQQLAEKHIELTHVRQALDAAATQADGEQAQLASTLRDMQADADSLRNHCKDLSAQLDAAKQQQQATTQVMAELQARHNDAQQQLKSAQAANKAQAQQHATALQRLEEKLQAERTNATLNQQRAEAQEAAVKNLETLLKQGNRVVDEAVASQKQAMAVNQEHVDMLKAQNAQLKKELQAEWQRNSRLEWELAQLRALEPAAPRAPHQGRDVAAHAFRAIESCIDATADSGGSPHGAGAHRPLLPVHAEPSMSSPGDARAAKAGAYTVSANASTPLPRDVAAAEAVFVHHANDEARRGQQLGDKHYEPSDLQPITLPQHSMKASEEPSPPPKAKGKGKGSGSKGTTARGSKRKAAADAAAEDDEDDEVEEEEEPTTRAAARKGAGKGKGAAKAAKTGTARRSSVPRSNIRAKQGSRLPLVEEEEDEAVEEAAPPGGPENKQGAVPAPAIVQPRTTMLPVVGRNKSNVLNSITARVGNAAANMQNAAAGAARKAPKANKATLSGHSTSVMPADLILGNFQKPKLAGRQ